MKQVLTRIGVQAAERKEHSLKQQEERLTKSMEEQRGKKEAR